MKAILSSIPALKQSNNDIQIRAWYEGLKDLSENEFRRGVKKFFRTHEEIYPTTNIIAHIRKYALIDELKFPTEGEAWNMVLKEMSRVGGSYGKPEIQCEPVQRAVETVSWREICLSDNPAAVRAHFFKVYNAFLKRHRENLLYRDEVEDYSQQNEKEVVNG